MEVVKRVAVKLTSGRWIATMTACAVWVILCKTIPPEVNAALLTLVLNSYFNRKRDPDPEP